MSLHKVMLNGYKQYVRSRECASAESIKRSKEIDITAISDHPVFGELLSKRFVCLFLDLLSLSGCFKNKEFRQLLGLLN